MSKESNVLEFRYRRTKAHLGRANGHPFGFEAEPDLARLANEYEARLEELTQLREEIAEAEARLEALRRIELNMRIEAGA